MTEIQNGAGVVALFTHYFKDNLEEVWLLSSRNKVIVNILFL